MNKTENLQIVFCTEEMETWAFNGVSIDITDDEFVAIYGAVRLW